MTRTKTIRILKAVAFVAAFIFLFLNVTEVLKDKRLNFDYDTTRKVKGFYNEKPNSLDFVFIGSSQMFTSVVPAVLWTQYGITSYDFGANEQPFWISYYYIKEALKYQKPKAIVLDVRYCFLEDEYQHEGANRINLDDLRWSLDKVNAIGDVVPKDESKESYFLEIMKYHTNWKHLNKAQFVDLDAIHNPYKGYTPFLHARNYPDQVDPAAAQTDMKTELPPRNKEFLLKIIELSKKEGFELLLLKIPDSNPIGQGLYNSVSEIAKENGITFVNYNTIMSGENHMNIVNAEKFTSHLGQYLAKNYSVTDKRGNPAFSTWSEDSAYFYQQKQKHLVSLEADLNKYLEYVNNPNYMVFISAKDEASKKIDAQITEKLRLLGFAEDLQGKFRYSYIGVIDGGKLVYERLLNAPLEYTGELSGLRITITSQGHDNGAMSSIIIGGKDLSQNKRGLNIVVYDKLLREVVDSVAFDTFKDAKGWREAADSVADDTLKDAEDVEKQ